MLSFDGWVLRAPSLQAGLAQLLDAPVLPLLILTLAGPSALAPRLQASSLSSPSVFS